MATATAATLVSAPATLAGDDGEFEGVWRLSVDRYHAMIRAGILTKDVDLSKAIDGRFVDAAANFLLRDHVDDFNDLLVNQTDSYDEMAISTSKYFLGVNLECVSCHDGQGHLEKINLWLSRVHRPQLWRQAAFFSKVTMSRPTPPDSCRVVLPIAYEEIVQLGDTSTNYQLHAGDRIFIPSKCLLNEMKKHMGRVA